MSGGTVEPEKMQQAVRENDFSLLPDFMAEAAKKATDALLTTRDGQRCDIILDRACLTAIHKIGKAVSYTHLDVYKRQAYYRGTLRECRQK